MRRDLTALTDGVFDLLILGGGITGAGVALDAVTRGLRVAVIDKGDFASATSSASSKLVHGGLRYLEHAEFRLVGEALAERRRLMRNAPHLVRPLRFVLPFYQGGRLPSWKAVAGLKIYDFLAGSHNLAPSRRRSAAGLAREFPLLRRKGLVGAAEYFDAQMDDARLCLEVVKTAWVYGAVAANYVEAVSIEPEEKITRVHARDRAPAGSGGTLLVQARQVLNATGPWVDAVCRLTGDTTTEPRLQPTKGVHLVVPDLGLTAAFLLLHPADGRVFFVIPWQGHTLIGTTDTDCDEPADSLSVSPADEQYLIDGYNHHFTPALTPADATGRFVGLRPLLRADAANPSARSREYRLFTGPGGMMSVAGGKYTTFRSMAEAITDAVAARLGVAAPCRTRRLPLDGTPTGTWDTFATTETVALTHRGLPEPVAAHVVNRYGRRAGDVATAILSDPAGLRLLAPGLPDVVGEWDYQRDHEMALCPADHLLRRSRAGLLRPTALAARLAG